MGTSASALLVAALVGGCAVAEPEPAAVASTGSHGAPLTIAAEQRIVPLRFVTPITAATDTNVDSVGEIEESIAQANRVWKAAGVQFVLHSYRRVVMPTFGGWLYADATHPTVPEQQWSAVRAQVQSVFPSAPPTFPVGSSSRFPLEWLLHSAYMYAPSDAIFVWLMKCRPDALDGDPGGNVCGSQSDGPAGARAMVLSDASIGGTNLTLAHELGHFFGVSHTDGAGAVDPSTGSPTTYADFWEFFYKPGVGTTTHLFFNTKDEALPFVSVVEPINRWGDSDGAAFDPAEDPVGGPAYPARTTLSACTNNGTSLSCDVQRCACPAGWGCGTGDNLCHAPPPNPPASIRMEPYDHNSQELQRGLTANLAGGPSINVMSYRGGLGPFADVLTHFSSSQIIQIRKHFEFDVPVSAAGADYYSGSGKRPNLGQRRPHQPHAKLDFDGDGRRDVAFWIPPTTAAGTGEFQVLLSTQSFVNLPAKRLRITGFGKLGDIPVLGDYTGDDRTDVAMYRPGGVAGTGEGTDASAWYWCATPTVAAGATVACTSPLSMTFGTRAETPLPGLRLGSANHYFTVFDGATNTWRWRPSACPPFPQACVKTATLPALDGSNEPIAGLFDGDDLTDLVSFNAGLAQFTARWSSSNYGTISTRQFNTAFRPTAAGAPATRSGAHVVRGIHSTWSLNGSQPYQWRQREALALWDPSTGNWQMDWYPSLTPAPDTTLCQWGQNRDIPIGGLGVPLIASPSTQLPPSRYDVFRSSGTSSTGDGFLHPRTPSTQNCATAAYNGSANQGATPARFAIGSVADMNGDGIPEMWQIEPQQGRIYSYGSPSYTSPTVIDVPYLAEIL